jgi:hypothetical protein
LVFRVLGLVSVLIVKVLQILPSKRNLNLQNHTTKVRQTAKARQFLYLNRFQSIYYNKKNEKESNEEMPLV